MRTLASRHLWVPRGQWRGVGDLAFYDGVNTGSTYAIGVAQSPTGVAYSKPYTTPILSGGQTWDAGGVKDPLVLRSGAASLAMWYTGYTGSPPVFQVGYATSNDNGGTWTEYASNPVLAPSGSGWDAGIVGQPVVFYEPTDVSRPYKMWYLGASTTSSGNYSIGYAYSTDGKAWTKSSANPVLTYTAAGFATAILPGAVIKVGSTYYLFCDGRPTPSGGISGDVVCLFTFTNPEGTYTAGGTLLSPSTAQQSLTSDLSAGATTVNVTSTSAFHAGEPVLLCDSTSTVADAKINTITSGTQMTLTFGLSRAYTVANSSTIRSLFYGSLDCKTILPVTGGGYELYLAPFQQFAGSPFYERSAAASSSSLGSGWSFDYSRSPLFVTGPSGAWDSNSAENPCVLSG